MANAAECPVCGQSGVPILYGLPTQIARDAAAAGKVRLFGCVIPPEPDHWMCAEKHTWQGDDEQALSAAIDAAFHEAR